MRFAWKVLSHRVRVIALTATGSYSIRPPAPFPGGRHGVEKTSPWRRREDV